MDEERKFKPGDRVVLKYGGPQMTVEDYLLGDVLCNWVAGGKKVKGAFSEASLMFSPAEEK